MSDKPQHTPNVALLNECLHLRAAMRTALGCLDDPTGGQHVSDMRSASRALREALDAGQQDIPDLLAQVERLTEQRDALLKAAGNVVESGARLRSDPGTHELFLAELTNVIRTALKGEDDEQG